MALSRVKVWNPGDVLTAADQNGEFNNIINNPISLISPSTGVINFNLQAHTNLVPSAITASSGIAGQALSVSSSGVAVWGAGPVAKLTAVSGTSGTFTFTTTAFNDVLGSTMAIAVGTTSRRLLLQGTINFNVPSAAANVIFTQVATSTGVLSGTQQQVVGQVVAANFAYQGVTAWNTVFSPGDVVSRQYVIQIAQSATTAPTITVLSFGHSAIEFAV